jgi:alpha-L-rhamnosidase
MLNHGATTLWETWAYPELFPSQNHPMFGSIDEWFYRSLLGINSAAPGFEKIIIQPQPVAALTWARGSYDTPRGKVVSDWKKENGQFILHVIIPVNTKAIIRIPFLGDGIIKEGGIQLSQKFENGYSIIEIGSGDYTFTAIGQ